ncbi:MAG TPA: RidA family protein [Ktedonobacterales bacterium]|nr:RidA family protein [Ktedonobacterales bacterium]
MPDDQSENLTPCPPSHPGKGEASASQQAPVPYILQPPGWPRPSGYSPGVVATGRQVFISGQIGWDERGHFPALDFVGQARQALRNILTILAEAGGGPEHITRLTWYVVDKQEYMACGRDLGIAYRAVIGAHYPAMTVVQVAALLEEHARVEIEATAVVP